MKYDVLIKTNDNNIIKIEDRYHFNTIGIMSNFIERLQPFYIVKKREDNDENYLHEFIDEHICRDIINSLETSNSISEIKISIKFEDKNPLLALSDIN